MPSYEYRCKNCGRTFDKTLTIREHDQARKPQCPKCRSARVEQRPAVFAAVTKTKA